MAIRDSGHEEVLQRQQAALAEIASLFKGKGEEVEDGDVDQMLKDPPSDPHFPLFITSFAVIKDFLDFPGDASLVGIIFTTLGSLAIGLILMFWMLGKMSGGFWKKAMIKWFWKRYLLALTLEFLPFVKMIPATTILVLMAHYREKKIVRLMNGGLEILHKHGFKPGR